MRCRRFVPRPERGFTLVELLMAIALLGVGTAWIVMLFMKTWELWKRNFEELLLQRDARSAMTTMVQGLREAKTGSVQITKAANGTNFSQINFIDGRGRSWNIRQEGAKVLALMPQSNGISSTMYLADNVQALYFIYPNFADMGLVDVGLTLRKAPYQHTPKVIVVQLVERVMLRNP